MTRIALARWLRNQANGLQEPLLDGTELTRSESELINSVMAKLADAANLIEVNNQCDADALAGLGIEANAD